MRSQTESYNITKVASILFENVINFKPFKTWHKDMVKVSEKENKTLIWSKDSTFLFCFDFICSGFHVEILHSRLLFQVFSALLH